MWKFHSLYQVAKKLNGKLILVNYSTREKDRNEVKVMFVKNINYEMIKEYIKSNGVKKRLDYIEYDQVLKFTFEEYSTWLRELNKKSDIFPF